jgi:hypothetical protein
MMNLRQLTAVACLAIAISGVAEGQTVDTTLKAASAAHAEATKAAESDLLQAIDGHIKTIAQTGDLEAVKQLMAQKQRFQSSGEPPAAEPLADAVAAYHQSMLDAEQKLLDAYQNAVATYTKQLKIDQAEAAQAKAEALRKQVASRKSKLKTVDPLAALGDEPQAQRARRAWEHRQRMVDRAREQALAVFDQQAQRLERAGRDDEATEIRQWRDAFAKDDSPQTGNSLLEAAMRRYDIQLTAANRAMAREYQHAILQLTRAGQTEAAQLLEQHLADATGFGPDGQPLPHYELKDLETIGGKPNPPYTDFAGKGGPLVGAIVTYREGWGTTLIETFQPIYEVNGRRVKGERLGEPSDPNAPTYSQMARPGYAVGLIRGHSGAVLDGFQFVFMKRVGARLNPGERYESDWLGTNAGPTFFEHDGKGRPIVGITGGTDRGWVQWLGALVPPER